ncbi:helix-turn-helix domain-containing protein [Lacrimispora sp. JR3]|uniref:helix-turn-helix domain-containing protein n=1 Tax=Lacrimispora sinapis TaxID=3111456 RepID=UPI00374A7680
MTKQREKVEFRYYEIPHGEVVLALLGEVCIREYGKHIKCLHFHNLLEIGYCHWGTGEVVLGQEHIPFCAHSFMIVPPRLPHTTNSAPGTKGYWEWLYVDLDKFISELNNYDSMVRKNMLKRIKRTGYLLSKEENPVLAKLILGIMEECRNKKPYYKDSIHGMLGSCVVEFLRLSDHEERIMRRRANTTLIAGALDYVSNHYTEEIRIRSLAKACNISESHFRRVFEEGMNMKPVDYINFIRIQNACELLKKTEKNMEEVAADSGFASLSTFNRNFKKVLNTSPYQWKKSAENYESKLLHYRISAQKGWDGYQ